MPRAAAAKTGDGPKRPSPSRRSTATNGMIAAAQALEALRSLRADGILTGEAEKVSVRIDRGLLAAAARKLGSDNTTAVVQAALAAYVAPDPLVEWFLSDRDRLPDDFELAI